MHKVQGQTLIETLVAIFVLVMGIVAAVGLALMIVKRKTMKTMIPFGPFIALGVTLVFFFGYDIVDAYFRFFSFLG